MLAAGRAVLEAQCVNQAHGAAGGSYRSASSNPVGAIVAGKHSRSTAIHRRAERWRKVPWRDEHELRRERTYTGARRLAH